MTYQDLVKGYQQFFLSQTCRQTTLTFSLLSYTEAEIVWKDNLFETIERLCTRTSEDAFDDGSAFYWFCMNKHGLFSTQRISFDQRREEKMKEKKRK